MSDEKIGLYTEDEIFEYMTNCEGSFLGRSMYDAIFEKIHTQKQENKQLQQENQSLKKENKILRENAEHNDKVVDKVNWENQELKARNQKLNKQLEELNKFKFSYRKDETKISPIIRKQKDVEIIKNLENQQKEFIEYLEDYLKLFDNNDVYEEGSYDTIEEILSKYKDIIGSDSK